jgi:hypothetical protein
MFSVLVPSPIHDLREVDLKLFPKRSTTIARSLGRRVAISIIWLFLLPISLTRRLKASRQSKAPIVLIPLSRLSVSSRDFQRRSLPKLVIRS